MTDAESEAFFQWALPRLGLRWAGFRRVRGQVVKRVQRRIKELGLSNATAYRARLEADPAEWQILRGRCVVTISRFYRDRGVWDALAGEVLDTAAGAAAAAGDEELRCWSIGCASGEEPYTLAIAWKLAVATKHPELRLRVLATDVDERVLTRARVAAYAGATLRIRLDLPEGAFRVITCRNVVCTYFDEALQRRTLEGVVSRLEEGGFFVIGRRERLPPDTGLEPWDAQLGVYLKPRALMGLAGRP